MEQMVARGNVGISIVDPDGGVRQVDAGHNTLSYGCADAVAALFAGKQSSRPASVVFAYGTTSGLEGSFVINTDPRVQNQTDIITGSLTAHEVDVDPNPTISSGDDKYAGNVVTFKAMTTENSNTVYVYGFLLKAADGTVLAAKKLDSGIQKQQNYALSITWAVRFI